MANIGMGGQLPQNLRETTKPKDNEKITKKDDDIKSRESMAGSQQVEGKFKKEKAVKNTERYKAFKSAYNYMLGEEPEEEEIDEEMESAPLEEEKEEVKNKKVKPNLKEIEEYNTRDRFKAKLGLTLGDDFDEDAPLEEEEDMTPEQKADDNKIKLEAAIEAYESLIQYIRDSLGTYEIDKVEDLQLFLKYGMPEDAIIKFIMLQQISRAYYDFPNVMDMSIMLNKFKKLNINLSVEETQEIAHNDYGTSKRLKYTVSGFIYIPIPQVMQKIEQDMKDEYENEFHRIIEELGLPEFRDLKQKMPENIMVPMHNMITLKAREINELKDERNNLEINLKLPMIKNKEVITDKIKSIDSNIDNLNKELKDLEMKAVRVIFTYSFINSGISISEFNKHYPIDVINNTLRLMGVRIESHEIKSFLNQKVNIYALKPINKIKKELIKKSNEIFETRVKSAVFDFTKIAPPKQQQIIKNIRNLSFDANNNFYWLKQKRLNDLNNLSEELTREFEEN